MVSELQPYDEYIAERLANAKEGPKPLNIACPHCGADGGFLCRTATGFTAKTHIARWKAVGIDKPTIDDLDRNYWDGEQRLMERKLAMIPQMPWLRRASDPR